jgi:hypothetical protein
MPHRVRMGQPTNRITKAKKIVEMIKVGIDIDCPIDRSKGTDMKKLAVLLIAISSLLSGCVVYDDAYRGGNDRSRDRDGGSERGGHDRDRDGVPDRHDNRPNNPNRY